MNNKGVTLIELMIVVAILGILFSIDGYFNVFREYEKQESIILEQEKVLKVQKLLRLLVKKSKDIVKITNRELVADNFKITVSPRNNTIVLNNQLYRFSNFKIGNFRKDGNIIECDVTNSNKNFTLMMHAENLIEKKPNNLKPEDVKLDAEDKPETEK